ncbi:hypothetical protein [Streptomyces flaveolus]|uniref:hypothetical protein n=1 Tax=Streptomyces flaveolus TaxID=67297 RepID=UPI0036FACD0F
MAAALESGQVLMEQFRSVGGAVNDLDPAATAYAHRTQNFSLLSATVPELEQALDVHWARLAPHLNGMAAEGAASGIREATVTARVGPADCFRPHPCAPEVTGGLPYPWPTTRRGTRTSPATRSPWSEPPQRAPVTAA